MRPIVGLPPRKDLVVQKSKPLLSLGSSPFTLPEFKLLDTYLARINSHEPDQRWVRFEKGEIEGLLGVARINARDLRARLRNLCVVVTIEDPSVPGGFSEIALFERWNCAPDADGLWQVDLQCTESAKRYIFNVENLGYLRYRLQAIVQLRSRYSYLLFLYLEDNKFRSAWEVSVDALRQILNCEEARSYQEFKRFNDRVLKRAQSEIQEKLNYQFEYEPIRTGRSIKKVRFSVPEARFIEAMPNDVDDYPDEQSNRDFILSGCMDQNTGRCVFTPAEQSQILAVLATIPPERLPHVCNAKDRISFRWQAYLEERYAHLCRMDEKGDIRNPFAYFLSLLKADARCE